MNPLTVEVLHPKLIGGWSIEQPIAYFIWVVAAAFVVRAILSWAKAIEVCVDHPERTHPEEWRLAFMGKGERKDYWQPFALGILELSSYPILMVTENWTFIGAWAAMAKAVRSIFLAGRDTGPKATPSRRTA